MAENSSVTIDQVVTSSADPGERDREEQTRIDRMIVHVGNTTAWLFPILMLAICTQVILRKLGHNQAWLDDAQWWIYGFAMTIGFVYAITTQSHVRVDILHQNFSKKKKARIEVFALGWLLLPFLIIMADVLIHYGWTSFLVREGSDSPNGLHHLYLLKLSMPVIFILGMLASFSMVSRHLSYLTSVSLHTMLIATFPAAWFLAERFFHYSTWWAVRLTNSELRERDVSRHPLLEYSIWLGLAAVLIAIVVSFILNRQRTHG